MGSFNLQSCEARDHAARVASKFTTPAAWLAPPAAGSAIRNPQ